MCGIYGGISSNFNELDSFMEKGKQLLKTRGPDFQKYEHYSIDSRKKYIAIGSNRLAITDIENGNQPMNSKCNRFCIVFNGQIFNQREIREELVTSYNVEFDSTHSDTEVILYGFIKFGESICAKLNGMFSFAIYDKKDHYIFLATDTFSIKSLVYTLDNKTFKFTSDLYHISKDQKENNINTESINQFLRLGFITPPSTAYKNTHRFVPGTWMKISFDSDGFIKKETNRFRYQSNKNNLFLESTLEDILIRAIHRWSSGDVPICSLLSSGIDSALICAALSKQNKIDTYSFGFSDDHLFQFNELNEAKSISRYIGSNHNEVLVSEKEFFEDLPNILNCFAEPFSGGIPSYYLFRKIAKDFKVAMTGHGADELFGNYGRVIDSFNNHSLTTELILNYLQQVYTGEINKYLCKSTTLDSLALRILEFNKNNCHIDSFNIDFHTQLPCDFLRLNDIFPMYFSVEARTPYLDQDLLAFRGLSPDLFTSSSDHVLGVKSRLKLIAQKYLPEDIIKKKKQGFSFPFSFGLRNMQYSHFIEDNLLSGPVYESDYINKDFIPNVVEPFIKGDNSNLELIWRVLSLSLWFYNNSE